jgi:hypothetical protein
VIGLIGAAFQSVLFIMAVGAASEGQVRSVAGDITAPLVCDRYPFALSLFPPLFPLRLHPSLSFSKRSAFAARPWSATVSIDPVATRYDTMGSLGSTAAARDYFEPAAQVSIVVHTQISAQIVFIVQSL